MNTRPCSVFKGDRYSLVIPEVGHNNARSLRASLLRVRPLWKGPTALSLLRPSLKSPYAS